MAVKISSRSWGQLNNVPVFLYRLQNNNGAYVELTNYGATLVSVVVPDRQHILGHVVVGFPSLQGYLSNTCYIGSTIGRYANRISGAKFSINGHIYHLDNNDGGNCNHGGKSGLNCRVFESSVTDNGVQMAITSPDGDGGFPGNLALTVTYTWNDDNELLVNYQATTDKDTIANFTNHAYFNLSGFKHDIQDHELTINSGLVLHAWSDHSVSGAVIPAGPRAFNNNRLSDKFQVSDAGIKGLNLFYVTDKDNSAGTMTPTARLIDGASGRTLEVYTDYPGIFLYTGDFLTSTAPTHTGEPAKPFDALCLECQHYPDSINHQNFPQAVLRPGETYNQNIRFKFGLL
ncbi:galactose mutarotase [Mucilaginibacter sp. 14171R-50]|uniref:aldose epimerase family protein n=1 Tax=Mucilaginibacter sp. 14171R-50 TaxID=2703789 RepID=UPI00138C1053|nr:aldose epimerase family protein [Mucilaginibacter sp. 14171R-50]QHS56846.1 galactose mutarotase [Mucilaginibacter sp. 14171R-50]